MAEQLIDWHEEYDPEDLKRDRAALRALIDESDNVVFYGGAGTSTESGIPDFRGKDGIYNQDSTDLKYPYPPEEIVSHSFFLEHPREFYQFFRDRLVYASAKPNAAHRKLAELEHKGKVSAIITQNLDGLHQKAGSKNVFELHGSSGRFHCMNCGKRFGMESILDGPGSLMQPDGIPHCDACGGIIKPDVVLYQEPLDQEVWQGALHALEKADMLLVGGSSLVVYPAAGIVDRFAGERFAIVNLTPTTRDKYADLVSRVPLAALMDW